MGHSSSTTNNYSSTTVVKERPITITIPEKYLNEPDIANVLQQKAHELCAPTYTRFYNWKYYNDIRIKFLGHGSVCRNYLDHFAERRIKSKKDFTDIPMVDKDSKVLQKCDKLKWENFSCHMLKRYMQCEYYGPRYPNDPVVSRLCQNSHMIWESNGYFPIEYHTQQILKGENLDDIDLKFESQRIINLLEARKYLTQKEIHEEANVK
jgi:hypothetical protein